MGMLLQINPESGLLNVVATGDFSLPEAKRTFLELLEAMVQHRSNKVIVDGRRLTGEPELMERFYFSSFAADMVIQYYARGVLVGTPFAFVLTEPVLDPNRFGETVALNRGMNVKVFHTPEQAFHWLGIPTANKPDSR
jgi:hypothetical protein